MAQSGISLTDSYEFNSNAVIQEWLSKYNNGDFLSLLKKHWKTFVPVVYASGYDTAKEERLANRLLFVPLETFICNGDPKTVFEELKSKDKPAQICGHVFKNGEPTYSCRECGCDPTCVLCVDCFQKSAHKKHRYRMFTSSGGGYCDCGDIEAWKTEPFCDIHKQGIDQDGGQNPIENLADDLIDRASILFLSTMKFAVDLLTWEQRDSLPEGLQPEGELADTYITMLFNDEVHTYEQVITSLQRAVECQHKEAVEYATIVDREGRSNVKQGEFAICEKARNIIEHHTSRLQSKALKVVVMHTSVVAHQQFALRLITWLHTVIGKSDGLRRLFCLLTMKAYDGDLSLMEKLLLNDTQLWKVARLQSHKLLMAGVLMDPECKKQFAIIFTKLYPKLMADFCVDDHDHDASITSVSVQIYTVVSLHYSTLVRDFMLDDHYRSVSITSNSVQIFTVPTLARMLITEHNLLSVILKAFLQHCEEKINSSGRLFFDRTDRNQVFKRACYMLYDLKYTLTCKPSEGEWTDSLRTNFLSGFRDLLHLLSMMQYMDPVTRQTDQHLEYEPEWESAFNLQLKLEDNIALAIEWCSSDKKVLIAAYRATIEILVKLRDFNREICQVLDLVVSCVKYDVSTQPISVHLPVTRLLAGLHVSLGKYGLSFFSPELLPVRKLDPAELIENAIRVQVMIAQTQAGMWRRNGYSLLNQIFFYHNVKCRGEMYDKDIVMLQVGASLLNGNDFLIHLLGRYGLKKWITEGYDQPGGTEDWVRQTVMLAEEFLNLLIIICGERYVQGIGEVSRADSVKREIIHQLCIAPVAHSELAKALPENFYHETGIEAVVNDVAVFEKPPGPGKGTYILKPEYYSMYNPYFYHYSRADQSKSEEAQLKRKKLASENQAFPPPLPPAFTPQFMPILNFLECDIMIHIMKLILTRTGAQRSRSWSELQFERVLHLIGLGLHEQKRAHETNNEDFNFLSKVTSEENNILRLLEGLVGNHNLTHDSQKDLLTWVLKMFSDVRKLKNESHVMETVKMPTPTDLLAKSEKKKKKAELAAKRRNRIMAQMSAMQKSFIKDNAELFASASTEITAASSDMDLSESPVIKCPVVLGKNRSRSGNTSNSKGTCILCQEEQDITGTGKAMVLAAYVQKSTVLSQSRCSLSQTIRDFDPLFMPSDLYRGTHTMSCGHIMHADCWQRYFASIVAKERRRPLRFRHTLSYDIGKQEFLCPLCESINNTVIPLVPPLTMLVNSNDADKKSSVDLQFNDWLDGIQKTVHASIQNAKDKESEEGSLLFKPCPISTITKMMAESVARNFQLLWEYVYDDASSHYSEGMREMLKKFARDVYSFGLGVDPDDSNPRVPIMAWSTCAFTLQTIEQSLRDDQKPLFGAMSSRQADCLSSLIRYSAVCSQVMPTDLVKEHCVRLLSAFVYRWHETACLLDVDMFHYLVVLAMTLPTLHAEAPTSSISTLPLGGLNDQHALQFVLTAHLVQIMLVHDTDAQVSMEEETSTEGEALLAVYTDIRKQASIQSESCPQPCQLERYIREAVTPFLRCAALLYHYITGVNPPPELNDASGEQFEPLCSYLALPQSLSSLLTDQGEVIQSLITRWCRSEILKERLSANSQVLVRYPLRVNQLITLPEDYSELIFGVSSFTCPKSDGDDSRAPTMCLVCGKMLCSHSYCCQTELDSMTVGAATAHSHTCGSGIGIFLRVRDCQILLLSGKTKGCFYAPPYLDTYGETDQGLRRGNPLHLCAERYKKLHKLWFNHGIPEEIAHTLEYHSSLLSIDWQNL